MKVIDFLRENTKWLFYQDHFENLNKESLSVEKICAKLREFYNGNSVVTKVMPVSIYPVEFCLFSHNKERSLIGKFAIQKMNEMRDKYLHCKSKLDNLMLPAYENVTRLESIAEIIVGYSKGALSRNVLDRLILTSKLTFNLNVTEQRLIETVSDLYKCKLFCLSLKMIENHDYENASIILVSLFELNNFIFGQEEKTNDLFDYCVLNSKQLDVVADCFGNIYPIYDSNVVANNVKDIELSCNSSLLFGYENDIEVLGLPNSHAFSDQIAMFYGENKSLSLCQKLFVYDNAIITKYKITNKYRKHRKIKFRQVGLELNGNIEISYYNNVKVFRVTLDNISYFYSCVIKNIDKIDSVEVDQENQVYENNFTLNFLPKGEINFEVFHLFAESIEEIEKKIEGTFNVDASNDKCIFVGKPNNFSSNKVTQKIIRSIKDAVLSDNNTFGSQYNTQNLPFYKAKGFNSSYFQIGNISTAFDVNGVTATLLGGFLSFPYGENIYVVCKNNVTNILRAKVKFTFDENAVYEYTSQLFNAKLTIEKTSHGKRYVIEVYSDKPVNVIFDVKFARKYFCSFDNDVFASNTNLFRYVVNQKIDSFTTIWSELSPYNFKENFSNETNAGQCVTFCVKNVSVPLVIDMTTQFVMPIDQPIFSNSALALSLNYYNDKFLFNIHNGLIVPNAFAFASIVFTNAQFVYQYIGRLVSSGYKDTLCVPYFDENNVLRCQKERYFLTFAVLNYISVTSNYGILSDYDLYDFIESQLCSVSIDDYEKVILCYCNLLAGRIFDNKVDYLTKYTDLVNSFDEQTLCLANAFGAVELTNANKRSLSGIIEKYNIPKNWQYYNIISQLYGVHIYKNTLSIKPKTIDKLEDITINLNGREFRTNFVKNKTKVMKVNDVTCYSCFCVNDVNNESNNITVTY